MADNKFPCKYCNKQYSSKQSRSNHYYLYHNNNNNTKIHQIPPPLHQIPPILIEIQCELCNKIFSRSDSLTRHINLNRCKKKSSNKNELLEKKINKLEKDFLELSKKTTPTTLVNNINNGININVNSLGYENIQSKLLEKEKINLLTSVLFKEFPLIELVRKIYTDDKFKEDRNTLLTNLQNKSCLVYKSDVNKFEATNKNEHIDNIITARKDDLISMYAEFSESTKIKDYTKKLIEDYLEKVEGINKKDKKLKALYEKHKEEIIYIIYNCKEFMGSIRNHLIGENDIDL